MEYASVSMNIYLTKHEIAVYSTTGKYNGSEL
jgi:hypothetical protein